MNAEVIKGHSTTQDKHNVAIGQSPLLLGRSNADQTLIHMGCKGQTAIVANHRIAFSHPQGVMGAIVKGW
jgi:hypothetical protein